MLLKALPFFLSYVTVPFVVVAALYGGWYIALPFLWGWVIITLLDRVMGLKTDNLDPATRDSLLLWHNMVTWAWVPTQLALMAFVFWQVGLPGHLGAWESVGVAAGLGVATGGIGITFAHELIHRRNRWERHAGDLLLVSVCYGHFATEHVYGHHITVGTPKDPVSARKGESFYAFFVRAVVGSLCSAWRIEANRLERRGLPIWHRTNPFWRYWGGSAVFLILSIWLAGPWGLLMFAVQCYIAIYQLEAVNYVEHYGLTRQYLGNGKFERVRPHHSWNASHAVSNWFLINLQRHSDHHYRPDRRFPLLQHYSWEEAPQLPFNYSLMIAIALTPPAWFWVMNQRVDRWRASFYPDVTDWAGYDDGTIGQGDTAQPEALPA